MSAWISTLNSLLLPLFRNKRLFLRRPKWTPRYLLLHHWRRKPSQNLPYEHDGRLSIMRSEGGPIFITRRDAKRGHYEWILFPPELRAVSYIIIYISLRQSVTIPVYQVSTTIAGACSRTHYLML